MELLKRNNIEKHTERVLQFGEGNFLRGFVDWMFDRLNKERGGDFGVVVVQPKLDILNGGFRAKRICAVFPRFFGYSKLPTNL